MKKLPYILVLSAASLVLLAGCKKKEDDNVDLSSIRTTAAAAETMSQTTRSSESVITIETEAATAAQTETAAAAAGTPVKKETYKSGRISIEYPMIYDTGDSSKESAVNQLIKDNAISVIKALELDEARDTLTISSEVITADRKQVTILYTGTCTGAAAAYPTNIFFTNMINLNKVSNIRLSDHADPYTMAGYVLSGDCQFVNVSAEVQAELMKVKNDTALKTYTDMFTQADFPFDSAFPQSFSYEKQGNIYFSIPVPHALGDYAIVKFTPDTK